MPERGDDPISGGYGIFSRRIALIGATNVVGALASLLVIPLLTKTMSAADYGVWVQVVVTVTLMPLVVDLGLPGALVRFLAAERDEARIREGFYSVLAVVGIAASVACVTVFALAGPISEAIFDGRVAVVRLAAFAILLECVNAVLFNHLRAFQRIKLYSGFIVLQTLLLLGILSGVLAYGMGLIGAVLAFLASKLATTVAMLAAVVPRLGLARPRFSRLREFLGFGLPMVPVDTADWILSSADRYLIGALVGVLFVGYYNPGYSLSFIVLMLATPLRFLLPAALSELYDRGRLDRVRAYLKYSLKYFLVLAIPVSVGLGLLSRRLLLLLTTNEIASEGYQVTPIVAAAMVLYGVQIILSQVLILEKRTKVIGSVMAAAAGLNVVLNVAAIPWIGIVGAAWSTLASYAFSLAATTGFALRYMDLEVDVASVGKTLVASAAMGAVVLATVAYGPAGGHAGLVLAMAVGAGVYACAILLLRTFSRREMEFFRGSLLGLFRRGDSGADGRG